MHNLEVKRICFDNSLSKQEYLSKISDAMCKTCITSVTDEISESLIQWEKYVRIKDASFGYALPSWFSIFYKAFGHKTYALMAFENTSQEANSKSVHTKEKKLVGILPICHVQSKIFGSNLCSLPFVNYGGLLCDSQEVGEKLIQEAQKLRQELKSDSIELRHMESSQLQLPAKADHKVSMILDLRESSELLWKSFKDKVRNQVRKAQKNGLYVVRGGQELLDDFYKVFCVNMRDLGTPVYAKSFFQTVLEHLPRETEILCVYQNEQGKPSEEATDTNKRKCVAAGILYRYGDTMQMPWASSLLAHRSHCPNHILYWEAMHLSVEEGFTYFDFGRSTPQSGPWAFKKQWGVREVPLCWEYILEEGAELPALSVNNPKYQLAIKAWKKLPLFLANTLGPHIVRGIP